MRSLNTRLSFFYAIGLDTIAIKFVTSEIVISLGWVVFFFKEEIRGTFNEL